MASEALLKFRWRYPVTVAMAISFVSSGYCLAHANYLWCIALFCLAMVAALFLHFLSDAVNKSLAGFFNALSNDDTAIHFGDVKYNRSLKALFESMNKLNSHFQSIRLQNEYNEKYYKTLIRYSATGLIVINEAGTIELINKTACEYAGISPDSTNQNLLGIKNPPFYEAVLKVKPGEEITYRQITANNLNLLMFRAIEIRKNDGIVKLVSLQDIRHELESKELESFRKLISVLTHEIMNLMSPLTSVSKSLYQHYYRNGVPLRLSEMDEPVLQSTLNGLKIIDDQVSSILKFVDNYRRMSKIPNPVFNSIDVAEWAEQLKIVFTMKMAEAGIEFSIVCENVNGKVKADKHLMNQVLFNLINNGYDAVMENANEKKIGITMKEETAGRFQITVSNNGPDIPPEILENIFVPFYTTKTHGSGIGLSICQEIIKLHRGTLTVVSANGRTSFIVKL